MKRWDRNKGAYIESPQADSFLKEIIEVFKKHNLSIGHEDRHGGFEIELYNEQNVNWLLEASVLFKEGDCGA